MDISIGGVDYKVNIRGDPDELNNEEENSLPASLIEYWRAERAKLLEEEEECPNKINKIQKTRNFGKFCTKPGLIKN